MVDDAHAVGASAPAAAAPSPRPASRARSTSSSARSASRSASYGAYACLLAEMRELLVNTARTADLLDRPAARLRRRGRGGARADRGRAGAGRGACGRTPPSCARRCATQGLEPGAARTQIIPVVDRRPRPRGRRLPPRPRRRRLRAGDPAADRARGDLAAAADRDGDATGPAELRAAAARSPTPSGRSPPTATGRSSSTSTGSSAELAGRPRGRDLGQRLRIRQPRAGVAPARVEPARERRLFVTGTGTEVGKSVVAAVIARTAAAAGRKRSRVFKPAVSGLDDGGESDHALLRRASGTEPERGGDRSLPLRPARLPAPGRRAGRRGDRARAAARAPRRRRRRAPTSSSARASAGCSSR